MSRVEENAKIIEQLITSADDNRKGSYEEIMCWNIATIGTLMADISKSLAVIADGIDDVKDYVNE